MIIDARLETYAETHTRPESDLLQHLARDTRNKMPGARMLTGRVEGRLLKMLAQMVEARSILEVGMFTGYSALSLAEGMPDDGHLITCEIDPKAEAFARQYIDASPQAKKIEIRMGPALQTISQLPGPFDLIFVDADKENYPAYFEAVIDKVRPGGLLIFDNTLWDGEVLDPKTEEGRAIHRLNGMLARDARVENVLLSVRDGVQLARKVG